MLGLSNTGVSFDTADIDNPPTSVSPKLTYDIYFEHPGTYYVWMLGRPCRESDRECVTPGGANSAWVQLDDGGYVRMGEWGEGDLTWESDNDGGTLNVTTAGVHQVNVYMREDGFEWNKIVLTTDWGYSPSGAGPEDTFCGTDDCLEENQGLPPWGDDEDIKPPGLRECHVSPPPLTMGSFEGSSADLFANWTYQSGDWVGRYAYDGALSMRLDTTKGDVPNCDIFPVSDPYLYQLVAIPADVYTQTTFVVQGMRLIAPSQRSCCWPDTTDPDDVLYLQMRDASGNPLPDVVGNGVEIANGGVTPETWAPFSLDVTDVVSPSGRAGQQVQVYFHGVQDKSDPGEFDCTYFYLDALRCEICTYWDIPDPITGTASFGGPVYVFTSGGIPQLPLGTDVWAYSADAAQVYHTTTIHDGTYHFYNVPPGTYMVYAEYRDGEDFRTSSRTVTVVANERNYNARLTIY